MSKDFFSKLLVKELNKLFYTEKQLLKALREFAEASLSSQLKEAFEQNQEDTANQIQRLEKIYTKLGQNKGEEPSKIVDELIKEGKETIKSRELIGAVKDAALIATTQKIEHLEIAMYGTLSTFASELGLEEVADLLQESLEEEEEAIRKLTEIAEGGIFTAGVNQMV